MTPEQNRAKVKAWREANRERERERVKKWKRENKERVNAATRARYAADPQSFLSAEAKRRGLKRAGDLTRKQWLEILGEFDHHCAYCNASGVRLTQDHMTPLSRGGQHTRDNIVPACLSCNASKGVRTLLEWIAPSPSPTIMILS